MLSAGKRRIAHEAEQAKRIGATRYIWRSCGDAGVCEVCAANDGKRFRYGVVPAHGHPGTVACAENGFCRCYAETIIPKRDY